MSKLTPRAANVIRAKALARAPASKPVKESLVKSWSFSRYTLYRQCPHKFKLSVVDRQKEPQNAAMKRGDDIHQAAENYIKARIARIPDELKKIASELKMLRALFKRKTSRMIVEDSWAFTREWTETFTKDWINCWLRIKLDCGHWLTETSLVVTDWKSGKFREESCSEYLEQLELYALGAFLMYPFLEEVRPRLVYTDLGIEYPPAEEPIVYTRADLPRLKKEWEKRVKPMFTDKRFAPRPGWYCRYCFFSSSNLAKTGLCKF